MPNGDFHYADNSNRVFVFRGSMRPDRLRGFSNPTDPGIATLSGHLFVMANTASLHKTSDLAGYGAGGRTYGIFRRNPVAGDTSPDQIGVYRMNEAGDGMDAFRLFVIVWIPSDKSPSALGNANAGMGALWSFENKIIGQSHTGLYQIDVSSFDFDNAGSTTVNIYFLSDAVETLANDGVNCMLAKSPWQPCPDNSDTETPLPQDCKCNQGYTGPNGASGSCTACTSGSYKDTRGTASCTACPQGKTSWPKAGGSRCVCDTPPPLEICGCQAETVTLWREHR